MRALPERDPGVPDHRSAGRYLLWLARKQWWALLISTAYVTVYFSLQALLPAVFGAAVDDGLTSGDPGQLLLWAGAITGMGAGMAVLIVPSHRAEAYNWYDAAYRTVQVVTRDSARLGSTLARRLPTGDVVAVGTTDIDDIGEVFEHAARIFASFLTISLVSALVLRSSVPMGLAVLIGVPLIVLCSGPLMRPLHQRESRQRDLQAEVATRAGDIVAGLRVLRGIGGEHMSETRYAAESQRARAAGVHVGWLTAGLRALQVLLPGLLVTGIIWFGARLALAGGITAGQLVTFYGYTAYLMLPVHGLMKSANLIISAHVSARRIVKILSLPHDLPEPEHPATAPEGDIHLHDAGSGVTVRSGQLTGIACTDVAQAALIADRLGRYRDDHDAEVTMRSTGAGDQDEKASAVRLRDLPLDQVRERILVGTNNAVLFSGVLREELSPDGGATEEELHAAIHAACADDIVTALPGGLDGYAADHGREFSGGQQQRLRLARALVAAPEVLILVEPASAVDAHTESTIAARLGAARQGRTTAVLTTSPLLLDRADHVLFVDGGRVVAEGTHRDLLHEEPRYRTAVLRSATVNGDGPDTGRAAPASTGEKR
ncbi:ABC transporter ATP-binding protein [Nocardiopsis rhodophaea]|uniref:ABC transporter ATP-binding protein n=1 Tax=Nocardiopsis rhodophaea TaxID=280238 RepID=A0ABN2SA35_9ACTN